MKKKCVIISDLKSSRELSEWEKTFSDLQNLLAEINADFAKYMIVPLAPTIGDEFQGAVSRADIAYDIYTRLGNRFSTDFYYGIGLGNIEKPFEGNIGMRGTAFYRAREALEYCKKNKRRIFVRSADTPVMDDRILNTLLHFIEEIENSWTKRQSEIVRYYRLHPELTYEKLAKKFDVKKQAIHKSAQGAKWNLLREGEVLVKEILRQR